MSLKSENNEQIKFDDLEFEAEYEEYEYETISGKEPIDINNWEKIPVYELDPGVEIEGVPNITHFKNDDKKYDSLRVRVANDGEYTDLYVNIPKPDHGGYIKNIRKSFDFYRTCFDFIYSILKYRDERNVVNKDGEEVNKFNMINILSFAKYVDQMSHIGVRITEGNPDSEYNSWIIYKME